MSVSLHTEQATGRKRRLFSVDDYERLGAVGVLRPEERTELIEGEIINVTPMGSRHSFVITKLINDVNGQSVHEYRQPSTAGYQQVGQVRRGEEIELSEVAGVTIRTDGFLP